MYKKIIIAILGVAVLGVLYYTVSPLFRNVEVDDALPEDIITGGTSKNVPSGIENLTSEELEKLERETNEANKMPVPPLDEGMPTVIEMEVIEESVEEVTQTGRSTFPVMGTLGHPASGHVRVLETMGGTIIRYEDFSTINGPNLHIYLAKDLEAREFIDLGPIKGTSGNINYTVPNDVSLEEYNYVMYWCVPFRVLFNYAEIS